MDQIQIQLCAGTSEAKHVRQLGRSAVHLRSGSCEPSSSGFYSAAMALIALRVCTRAELRTLRLTPQGRLEQFHSQSDGMAGCDELGMQALLGSLLHLVHAEGIAVKRSGELVQAVCEVIADGGVCLLSTSPSSFQYHHWILACGLEHRTTHMAKTPTALLALDPTACCTGLALWNARIALDFRPAKSQFTLIGEAGELRSVYIRAAFALHRRTPP